MSFEVGTGLSVRLCTFYVYTTKPIHNWLSCGGQHFPWYRGLKSNGDFCAPSVSHKSNVYLSNLECNSLLLQRTCWVQSLFYRPIITIGLRTCSASDVMGWSQPSVSMFYLAEHLKNRTPVALCQYFWGIESFYIQLGIRKHKNKIS